MAFQRRIGAFGLLFIGITSLIGSGWLFGPLFAARIAGPGSILCWIIGGLFMIIISLTFAELGSTFPVAGGIVHFAKQSHGSVVSFIIGWMVWMSSVAVAPVETLGMMHYAANYIPGLMVDHHHAPILTTFGIIVSALIMGLMCVLNYYGAKFFIRVNTTITIIKLIVPIATIALLLIADFHWSNFSGHLGFLPYGWHSVFAALPLGGIIYSFIGSNTILQMGAETKNPQRLIPFAIMISILICMVIYALLQIAFVGAVAPPAFANGWNELNFPGDMGPFAGIMMSLGLGWFVIMIYADAVISPFGTGLVYTTSTARIGYGLSELGFFPKSLQRLTTRGIPLHSMMMNYIFGLLLFLPFPSWQKLVSFIISCFVLSYMIGPISLVALRDIQPNIKRVFLLPAAKTISLIAFYLCNLLIYWTGWQTISRMMIVIIMGLIFYTFYFRRHPEKNVSMQWGNGWWLIPYFSGLSIISFLGSFGGGKSILSFGADFLAVALLTITVFYLALAAAKHKHSRSKA